jgi:hypothetical protein
MGRTTSLLLVLAFLQACRTPPPKREPASDPRPPPPAQPVAPAAAPAPQADPGIERLFRAPLAVCFDGALKVCRDRDVRVLTQERTAQGGRISAQARGLDTTWVFARGPGERTQVGVRVQGRTAPENRDAAVALLNTLSDTLLEPRD